LASFFLGGLFNASVHEILDQGENYAARNFPLFLGAEGASRSLPLADIVVPFDFFFFRSRISAGFCRILSGRFIDFLSFKCVFVFQVSSGPPYTGLRALQDLSPHPAPPTPSVDKRLSSFPDFRGVLIVSLLPYFRKYCCLVSLLIRYLP